MATPMPRRLLVADDYVSAADAIAEICNEHYEVRTAYSGREALRTALEWHPHVAILDIDMPAPNGLAIAASIRVAPGLEPISLIAVTGRTDAYDRDLAIKYGFDAFLPKPVNPRALLDLLAKYMSTSE
jgi:CheY-like chemotaxis protein